MEGVSEISSPKSQTSHLIIESTSSLFDHGLTFSFMSFLATKATFSISCPFNKRAVVTFRLLDINNSSNALSIRQGCDTGDSGCSPVLQDAPPFLLDCPSRLGPPSPGAGVLLVWGHMMLSVLLVNPVILWVTQSKYFCRNGGEGAFTVVPSRTGKSEPLLWLFFQCL